MQAHLGRLVSLRKSQTQSMVYTSVWLVKSDLAISFATPQIESNVSIQKVFQIESPSPILPNVRDSNDRFEPRAGAVLQRTLQALVDEGRGLAGRKVDPGYDRTIVRDSFYESKA